MKDRITYVACRADLQQLVAALPPYRLIETSKFPNAKHIQLIRTSGATAHRFGGTRMHLNGIVGSA